MKLEYTLLIISFILTITATLYEINFLDYKSPIEHSKWREINWKDFKGLNPPILSRYDAHISTELRVSVVNDTVATIAAYFHPSRSYVFSKRALSKGLLQHELYHFHITEYVARVFRKNIIEGNNEYNLDDLQTLKQQFLAQEDSIQRHYDFDTNHSHLLGKQKKWEEKIDSLLSSLELYSDHDVQLGKSK